MNNEIELTTVSNPFLSSSSTPEEAEIKMLRATVEALECARVMAENENKSDNYNRSRLKQALEIIAKWNSLGAGYCQENDVECQRDFYRQVAQDALDIVKKLEG
jgi:hypothetical protein